MRDAPASSLAAGPRRQVVVSAPARLHLGRIDPGGTSGRRFGTLGVALEAPRTEVAVEAGAPRSGGRRRPGRADADLVRLVPDLGRRLPVEEAAALEARVASLLVRYRLAGLPAPDAAEVVVRSVPAPHVGFGSGTQLDLAVGTALARLGGHVLDATRLATALRRERRSRVGLAAFEAGGLVVDGGFAAGPPDEPGGGFARIAPVLAQHPLPEAWRFVVVVPGPARDLARARGAGPSTRPPHSSGERVDEICRRVLLQLLPAAIEGDLRAFGDAITVIQLLSQEAPPGLPWGRFASPIVAGAVAALLEWGAAGAGQSAFGPACYGLVGSESEGLELAERMRGWLAERGQHGEVLVSAPDNAGARVRDEIATRGAGRSRRRP